MIPKSFTTAVLRFLLLLLVLVLLFLAHRISLYLVPTPLSVFTRVQFSLDST